jgi:Uma2 family endonuclease
MGQEVAKMSAPAVTEVQTPQIPATQGKPARRSQIIIEDRACIPNWVDDLESFRRWAHSEGYPEHGWISYLNGEIWVDLDMEELFTHNQVKTEFTAVVGGLVRTVETGYFVCDRMLLSNLVADFSTEPDGLFCFWQTVQSGRLRLIKGAEGGYMELEGTPDMVLEIVSRYSERKDTVRLRDLYWRAGISEYWLVDVRGASDRFDMLRHTKDGYVAAELQDGWLFSTIFGQAFQLLRQVDPLGHPRYKLQMRALEQPITKP